MKQLNELLPLGERGPADAPARAPEPSMPSDDQASFDEGMLSGMRRVRNLRSERKNQH